MRVLIVGLGSIARKHVKALRQLDPDVDILALRSKTGEEEVGIRNVYDWNEIAGSPDFILIANPTRYHKNAIERSIRFGVPLFIEKPVLDTPAEGLEVKKQIDSNEILSYVACNLRFHPALLFVKDYLQKNSLRIMEVNVYCGSDLSKWRPGQDYTKSYSAQKELGGGVHLDLIHEMDYCCWIFGFPSETISIRRKVSPLQIDSMDFAAYHLMYPDFTINITLNYYRSLPKRTLEILTDSGILSVDLLKAVVVKDETEIFEDPDFRMEETYLRQMNYFVEHARKNKPMMNDFSEALEVLKLATA